MRILRVSLLSFILQDRPDPKEQGDEGLSEGSIDPSARRASG